MNKTLPVIAASLAALVWLSTCSNPTSISGVTDTESGELTGTIVYPQSGKAVGGILVRLHKRDLTDSNLVTAVSSVDSIPTNAQGAYAFSNLKFGRYVVTTSALSDSLSIAPRRLTLDTSKPRSVATDSLRTLATLTGSIKQSLPCPHTVLLFETPWQTSVDSSGNWQLSGIPVGRYLRVVVATCGDPSGQQGVIAADSIVISGAQETIALPPDTLVSISAAAGDSMLMADFDDGDEYSPADVLLWGGQRQTGGANGSPFARKIDYNQNHLFSLDFAPKIDKQLSKTVRDLSTLERIKIRLKGNGGPLRIRLRTIRTPAGKPWNDPVFDIDSLPTEWTEYSLDVLQSFSTLSGLNDGAAWPVSGRGMQSLWVTTKGYNIAEYSNGEVLIDDIRFYF